MNTSTTHTSTLDLRPTETLVGSYTPSVRRFAISSAALIAVFVVGSVLSVIKVIVPVVHMISQARGFGDPKAAALIGASLLPLLFCLGYLAYLLNKLLRVRTASFLLTTERVLHREGTIATIESNIEVRDITSFAVHQDFFDRCCGVATVALSTRDGGEVVIRAIHEFRDFIGHIDQLRHAESKSA